MKKLTNKKTPTAAADSADLALIKEFADFMKSNDLVEIDFKSGEKQLRLRRQESGSSYRPAPRAETAEAAAPIPKVEKKAEEAKPNPKYQLMTSPFVGTFYRSAGPNQDPFVQEGQNVNAGQTLCIVEAMKLMNEIESDIKGRVVRVLVQNGTPVEFGEALFEIDPA